ncbi:GNAT family N-acetyltransferase [Streptomyces sp. NPDC047928]|uniref:GNAT family N-acetyltransferase n=1 Tax=unclassified Streptomyces TaxID=2593676 RepID=UPI00370FA5DB
MMSSAITEVWVHGWAVNRGTPPPVAEPWGYRIDVGLPGHVFRHVLPEPDEATVRALCASVAEPGAWLKVLAEPEDVAGWVTPGWTVPDDPGFMMWTALRPVATPEPPPGYRTETSDTDGVFRVRILAADGSLAARGQIAPLGRTAVVDQVETYPDHRRRGLGSLVMLTLQNRGAEAGATTAVLSGTVQGRALYSALGWRYQGPLTGVVRN